MLGFLKKNSKIAVYVSSFTNIENIATKKKYMIKIVPADSFCLYFLYKMETVDIFPTKNPPNMQICF